MIIRSIDLRKTATAFVGAAFFSAICVTGAVAPARADVTRAATPAAWSATVSQQATARMRVMNATPDGIRNNAVAVVAIHFDGNGQFDRAELVRETGSRTLDREAMRVAGSINFPILPASMQGSRRVIPMQLSFGNAPTGSTLVAVDAATKQIAERDRRAGTQVAALPNG